MSSPVLALGTGDPMPWWRGLPLLAGPGCAPVSITSSQGTGPGGAGEAVLTFRSCTCTQQGASCGVLF